MLAPIRTELLQVREGDSWWGVDPSTLRVAIASVSPEGRHGVSTRSFPTRTGGRRLAVILYETRLLARSLIDAGEVPGVIVVEQPSGKVQNLQLVYAVGVITAAVAEAAPSAAVKTVVSSRWKSIACGKGDIYKPKREKGRPPPAPEGYGVLRWARDTFGYAGSSWDAADALGVANYAWRTYAIERV
jgi:hypothetical protein